MSFIQLTSFIAAPRERVFDLCLSVDLHKQSMKQYGEEIVNGVVSGIMQLNETTTWKARHLFKERVLQVKITGLQKPDFFIDEQVKGDFLMMKHEHYFKHAENGTIMIDQFRYEVKGIFGKWINRIYLEKYIRKLLEERNAFIKNVAEGNLWKQYLNK